MSSPIVLPSPQEASMAKEPEEKSTWASRVKEGVNRGSKGPAFKSQAPPALTLPTSTKAESSSSVTASHGGHCVKHRALYT